MDEMTAEETAAYCRILMHDKAIMDKATQRVRTATLELADRDVRERACGVLDEIKDALMGTNIDVTPGICGCVAPDESFGIEWITEDARLGFCIDQDGAESSWFIVGKGTPSAGMLAEYGLLSESKVSNLVFQFLRIIKEGKE